MRRSLFHATCLLIAVLCSGAELRGQQVKASAERQPISDRQAQGGIATMYALDPLSRALCFRDGGDGLAIQNYRWENRCSDLSFTLTGNGSFVSGIESNRLATIIDLGTADELRERYGYEDATSGGEGFASLRFEGGKFLIFKEDNPNETLQPLREGPALLAGAGPSANAPVKLGHIYLVRIVDKKDPSFQLMVKLLVVGYTPNESITLRWARL